MVDFEFRIKNRDVLENLKTANASALEEHGEGKYLLRWLVEKQLMTIQDDYFWIDLGDSGWITLDVCEFTPEMLVMMFEMKPELATEEVLLALFRAAGMK
jgi:hypothetical protein